MLDLLPKVLNALEHTLAASMDNRDSLRWKDCAASWKALQDPAQCAHFQVDNVARWAEESVFSTLGEGITLEEEAKLFPNIAPVAPCHWFEFRAKKGAVTIKRSRHCAKEETVPIRLEGVFARAHDRAAIERWLASNGMEVSGIWEKAAWGMTFDTYSLSAAGHVQVAAYRWAYAIDKDGGMVDCRPSRAPQVGVEGPLSPEEEDEAPFSPGMLVAMAALCFLHAKGVGTTEHRPLRQALRAAQRAGVPPEREGLVSYKTLDVGPTVQHLRERTGGATGVRAMHLARGHFARYGPEAPLFGRTVGTFYIPMHVRGNKQSGIVQKTYNVHPERRVSRARQTTP